MNSDEKAATGGPLAAENRRIELAYCLELGRAVTIDEARNAFVKRKDTNAYHFECSTPQCAGKAVRIAGVNYRFDATQEHKLVSNHFRRLDDHERECPFFCADYSREGEDRSGQRLRALQSDLISAFVPPFARIQNAETESRPARAVARRQLRARHRATRVRTGFTTSLSRLVDTFRALVATNIPNALRDHRIRVRGVGEFPANELFVPAYRAIPQTGSRVIYGGVRLSKQYGAGFKVRFYDLIAGVPAFIYVPAEVALRAPDWSKPISEFGEGRYCTAYAYGSLQRSPDDRSFSIDIRSPDELVLRTPPLKA